MDHKNSHTSATRTPEEATPRLTPERGSVPRAAAEPMRLTPHNVATTAEPTPVPEQAVSPPSAQMGGGPTAAGKDEPTLGSELSAIRQGRFRHQEGSNSQALSGAREAPSRINEEAAAAGGLTAIFQAAAEEAPVTGERAQDAGERPQGGSSLAVAHGAAEQIEAAEVAGGKAMNRTVQSLRAAPGARRVFESRPFDRSADRIDERSGSGGNRSNGASGDSLGLRGDASPARLAAGGSSSFLVQGTKITGDAGAGGTEAGSSGRLQPVRSRLPALIAPLAPSNDALGRPGGDGSARSPGAQLPGSLKRTVGLNRQRQQIYKYPNPGSRLQNSNGAKTRGLGQKGSSRDLGQSLEQHLEGFTVQALPGLPSRAPSGASGGNVGQDQDPNPDLVGVLEQQLVAREEERARRLEARAHDGPLLLAGGQPSGLIGAATRRYGKRSRHPSPRHDLKIAGPAGKLASRHQADLGGLGADPFKLSASELAALAAQVNGELRGLPLRHLPHYKLKICGKAVERKAQQNKHGRSKEGGGVWPARDKGGFGQRATRWGMTSEGSQANLDRATPTPARPGPLAGSHHYDPSAEATGQEPTSGGTPQRGRQTPSRDLLHTLGLNLTKTSGQIEPSDQNQDGGARSHRSGTFATQNIAEAEELEMQGSASPRGDSRAQEQISRLQAKSRQFLRADEEGSNPQANNDANQPAKDSANAAGANAGYTQNIPIIGQVQGQLIQLGQVVGPHVPAANFSLLKTPDATTTLSGAGPPPEMAQCSTLHGDEFDGADRGTNPIDGPHTASMSRERSNSSNAYQGRSMNQDLGLVAIRGGGAALVAPVSAENQATILQLLRKQGAVERVAFQSLQSRQPTGTSSGAKKQARLHGSAEKAGLHLSPKDAQLISNSSVQGMTDRPSKYVHEYLDGDGPSRDSPEAISRRPQPTQGSPQNFPAVSSSPLNSQSFEDLRDRSMEPGSFTLSPQATAKRASRPLFGPHKGSTFLLKNPHSQKDSFSFRLNDKDPSAAHQINFMADLQKYRNQLQAAEYQRLQQQIEEEALRHRQDRLLGNVGALIQLKRQLWVQGEGQAINQGLTADSLRYKLKDRRKRSEARSNKSLGLGVAQNCGSSASGAAGAASLPDNPADMDLRRALAEAAAANADAGDAGLDVLAQSQSRNQQSELVERMGIRTELQQFGSREGEQMIQLVDEDQPAGGAVQQLGVTSPDTASNVVSSNARASPLWPTGLEQGAKVTVNLQQAPQHHESGLTSPQPPGVARRPAHSRERLLDPADRHIQLSNPPSMETIGLAANKQRPTPLEAVDIGPEKPAEASKRAEVGHTNGERKVQGRGLDSSPLVGVADTGSADGTASSGQTAQTHGAVGAEDLGAVKASSGPLPKEQDLGRRYATMDSREAKAPSALPSPGESLKILDETIDEEGQRGVAQLLGLEPALHDVTNLQDHFKNAVGTSYLALSPLSPSFPSLSSVSMRSVFKSGRLSGQPLRMLREISPDGALLSRSPASSLVHGGHKDPPKAQALSHLHAGSKTNQVRGATQRHVFVERVRYGRVQNHSGKVVATTGPHDAILGPEEVRGLERSYPFATILDGAQVEKTRRLQALYHKFDAAMSTQRKQLQYALDVLPVDAKLQPAQPRAPQNRYFKKGRHRSVAAAFPGGAQGPFVGQVMPLRRVELHVGLGQQAPEAVAATLPIPQGHAYPPRLAQSRASTPRGDLELMQDMKDLMLVAETPLAGSRHSARAQSEGLSPPKNAEGAIEPLKKPSKEALGASNRRHQMHSQFGQPDGKRVLIGPSPVLALDEQSRKHLTDKFRASSNQQQHADASPNRRRHQLEINEIGVRPQNASFRATQGFESRHRHPNPSSQAGSLLANVQSNLQSHANNDEAERDKGTVETPNRTQYRTGPSGQRLGVPERSEQGSTERADAEQVQGQQPQPGSHQAGEDPLLLTRPQIRVEAQEGQPREVIDPQEALDAAYRLLQPQYPLGGDLLLQEGMLAGGLGAAGSRRILQSTENILDSSFLNSKNLKSVLKTAGKRKDAFTGMLFDPKHFERYKILQHGANQIHSDEGPLARAMHSHIQEQNYNDPFMRSGFFAREHQERHDFLQRVEQFKRELTGGASPRMQDQGY